MIILNQDKSEIINFDNISSIYFCDMWDDKPGQVLKAYDINGNTSVLGYYKNSERAKEILQEILQNYKNWEYMKVGKIIIGEKVINSPVYEMPENDV